MISYKKLYALLCGAQSDAIDLLEQHRNLEALLLLRKSLDQAEELYLASELDILPDTEAE